MDALATGWFSELSPLWPGQAISLEMEEQLFKTQSKYQLIEVFKSKTYGKVLSLDGIIQLTERDEFSYQEMMAHLPLFSHPNPETVCIIGGGDGAILSRVCSHKALKEIYLCEIDVEVINTAKQFFPQFSHVFEDKRVHLITSDGVEFLANKPNYFDVIITDSSDPIGPADTLFTENYYKILFNSLKENGIAASQGECLWLHLELIQNVMGWSKKFFNHVEYSIVSIPTYPSGQIGVILCSKGNSCKTPVRSIESAISKEDEEKLKYYTPEVHTASFVLPKFAHKLLQ